MKNLEAIIKRRINKLIILFLISFNLLAQGDPVVYYEFSTNSRSDILDATFGPDALSHNSVELTTDRHDVFGDAISFGYSDYNDGQIQLPNLTSYLPDLTNISSSDKQVSDFGYTISCWIRLSGQHDFHAPSNSELPYLPTDKSNQIFYVKDDRLASGEVKCSVDASGISDCELVYNAGFGLSVIRDRVVINRLMEDTDPAISWDLWLWDPVAITTSDWYHIVMVVKYNKTITYLFDSSGNAYCRSNYFRAPNLAHSSSDGWGIGSYGGSNSAVESVDDFKIYATAHDENLVKTNHNLEKPNSWTSAKTIKTKPTPHVEENPIQDNGISIYPNPNSGEFHVDFTLLNKSKVNYSLYSIDGRMVYSSEQNFSSGNHSLRISAGQLAAGMYFFNVKSTEFVVKGHKIIVD